MQVKYLDFKVAEMSAYGSQRCEEYIVNSNLISLFHHSKGLSIQTFAFDTNVMNKGASGQKR